MKKKIIFYAISIIVIVIIAGGCASAPAEFPYGTVKSPAGTRIWEFNEDGTHSLGFVEGNPTYFGTFVVEGNEITLTEECGVGTYTWTYDGEVLRFELVGEDGCGYRPRDLLSTNFKKVP